MMKQPHKQIRRHSLIASKSLLTKSTMQLSLDLFTERDIAKNRTPPLDLFQLFSITNQNINYAMRNYYSLTRLL